MSRVVAVTSAATVVAALLVAVPAASAQAATGGTVWTVGAGPNGQLGYGGTGSRTSFGPTVGLPPVTQVSGGREHVLALAADGHVWAWGDNPNATGSCACGDSFH